MNRPESNPPISSSIIKKYSQTTMTIDLKKKDAFM